ncbi:GNAT family N-acetyltransferase [Paraneptunicella aestuarii]|uniref:GNAT family N-acetyltransferase n=1 Tax=Paraneptunicella aestuarii TaxID=2831148 RepID=UPI001E52032B|nr:GNAT family protein [Paraneptunicella aestuarii]UAA37511.1 GNAT family N-acetyltransferase [Paraneptunicella aestuarii]
MKFEKINLEGDHVLLEPLCLSHKEGLIEAFSDGELWNLIYTFVPKADQVEDFIKNVEQEWQNGTTLAFAIIDKQTGKVAGTSRFKNTCWSNKRLEVGYTFIGKSYQRSSVHTETRLLMFSYAFETLQMNRIGCLIDYLNQTSRNAMIRLGAKEEGVLRNHMVMPDGRVRDSVMYSFIKNEWQGIKQNMHYKLSRYSTGSAQVIDLMQHPAMG